METKDEWSNKVIQMVPMSDGNHLFIVDFDTTNYMISIRRGQVPNLIIKSQVSINETTVMSDSFNFHINFLNAFIFANKEHYDRLVTISAKE